MTVQKKVQVIFEAITKPVEEGAKRIEKTLGYMAQKTGQTNKQAAGQMARMGVGIKASGRAYDVFNGELIKNSKVTRKMFDQNIKQVGRFKMEYLSLMFGFMAIGKASRKMWQSAVKTYSDVMGENNAFLQQTNKVRAAWEFLKFSLVDALMQGDLFRNIVDAIVGIVDKMSDWIGQHPELGKWIMIITGALMAIAPVISGIASMMLLWGGITKLLGGSTGVGGLSAAFGGLGLAGVAAFVVIAVAAWSMKEEVVKAYKAMKKSTDAELKGMDEQAEKYGDLAADHIFLAMQDAVVGILRLFETLFNVISKMTAFIPEKIPILGQISKASKGASFGFGAAADWGAEQTKKGREDVETRERAVGAEVGFIEQGRQIAKQREGVFDPSKSLYPESVLPLIEAKGEEEKATKKMVEKKEEETKVVEASTDAFDAFAWTTMMSDEELTELSKTFGMTREELDKMMKWAAAQRSAVVEGVGVAAAGSLSGFRPTQGEEYSYTPGEGFSPMQTGGIVPRTGPYMLHGGEMVTPKQSMFSAGGINITVNTGPVGSDVDVRSLANEVSSVIVDELRRTAQIGGL